MLCQVLAGNSINPDISAFFNMMDANAQLQELFNSHGIATVPLEQKFLLVSKQLALVGSRINQQEFPNGISSRLDVSLTIKDQVIIECFGDVGNTATEQIKNSLDAIKQGRTVVIISHSLAQIVDSDCIYVMKKGHMVEHGTHDELYDLRGTYREIFDASARSLNIERLAKSMTDDGNDVLDTAS